MIRSQRHPAGVTAQLNLEMKVFTPLFSFLGSAFLLLGHPVSTEDPRARPNIILMMADDMGMGDTSAYQDFTGNPGAQQIATPQMERLAREGVRFTDAHTPGSRCTPTRYSLLTGRYPWRTRMKWWVLFGAQGDPLIEPDRPTIASLLKDAGYRTAMVGKWHVGLRYRQSNHLPAAGWEDASLLHPLFTSPLNHGFDFARFTSRSHGTSGPNTNAKNPSKRNGPSQRIGPGHIDGRTILGATDRGRQLVTEGEHAYVLSKLGSRHSDHALEFLRQHLEVAKADQQPFFLYYPSNSNHGPYTPDTQIGGRPVAGAARTIDGHPMDDRHDYIYENDVALGRLLDWLESHPDPRRPGHSLRENTLVIFTSDNGAEKDSPVATGPFRSNKGSCYEGGHRVPFIASWPAGDVGNGDATTPGQTNSSLIGLQDLFATFSEIIGKPLPDLATGRKGAEDSLSILSALRGDSQSRQWPLFVADHKESTKTDPAVLALRLDDPTVNGQVHSGQWKMFFDANLIRHGIATPFELYELRRDQTETTNLLSQADLAPLVAHLKDQALRHRTIGGHRYDALTRSQRVTLNWSGSPDRESPFHDSAQVEQVDRASGLRLIFELQSASPTAPSPRFAHTAQGLGVQGTTGNRIEGGIAVNVRFSQDVVVESVGLMAGKGRCGGFYQIKDSAPLALYCIDADNDSREQEGRVTDIGWVPAHQPLRLDSRPLHGVEAPGSWWIANLSVRLAKER